MKNTRNYRLLAILLAVIMAFGVLPVMASAGSVYNPTWIYSYTAGDASFTYASNGNTVGSIAELVPDRTSTMTITVPDNEGLPTDGSGEIVVAVPENVKVTAEDAAACQGAAVSCAYRASTNQLVFKWTGAAQGGFTVTLPITPNAPATREDVSGTTVLVVKNKNGSLMVVQPTQKTIDGVNRLTTVQGSLYNGMIYRDGTDLPEWRITRHTGDWYSISYNGQYLDYGTNVNNISFSSTPKYFLYTTIGAGNQFVGFAEDGTKYFLNNKSNNEGKGIQASTYDDQCVEFYTKLKSSTSGSLVTFNVNGGTASSSLTPLLVEKGSTIVLPEYNGTKKDNTFIGWATTNNLRTNMYAEVYKPGDSYTIDADSVTFYAAWSSTTTEIVQFGVRMDDEMPDEPAQYDVGFYSKEHVKINNVVKTKKWIVDTNAIGKSIDGNHVVNSITANLSQLPTDDELKIMYPKYDPATMYVHWYVMKYAANMWKVDGVILTRAQETPVYEVRYDAGVATANKSVIKNIPTTYRVDGGSTVSVGTGSDQKPMKTPEYPEYIFKGWNTAKDGTGQSFQSGDSITVESDVVFYAQWEKIPKYKLEFKLNNATDNAVAELPTTAEYKEDNTIQLPAENERKGYLFSGWMANGEKIEGNTYTMPAEDVEITGTYYGPIDVDIVSDWPNDKIPYEGAIITLTALPSPKDKYEYTYQWQYDDQGEWANVEGATGKTYTYTLDEETSGRIWRVIITDAKPIE